MNIPTDDRRRPVQPRPGSEMVSNITGGQVSDMERVVALAANAIPLLVPVGIATWAIMAGGVRGLSSAIGLAVCPGTLFLILALGVRGLVLRTVRPLAGVSLSLPTVMAHGYCGACGYRVADTRTEADGCHVCPECGAAWHADRVTFPKVDVSVTVAALRHASQANVSAGRLRLSAAVAFVDDRQVGLPAPYCWPRGVFRSGVPAHAAEAKKALNRALGLGVTVVLVLLWIGGAVLATALSQATYSWTDRLTYALFIGGVCGFIHILVRMAKLPAEDVRRIVLQRRLCPSCWSAIDEKVEFDGCRRCSVCRAAWRNHVVLQTPHETAPE